MKPKDPIHEYIIGRARRSYDLLGGIVAMLLFFLMAWLILIMAAPADAQEVTDPQPETISDCAWAYQIIVNNPTAAAFFGFDDRMSPFLPRFRQECPDILPYFRNPADDIHALAVVQCESGFRASANDENWGHLSGGRPQGLWSFMSHLNWRERLGFPWLDYYDTTDASFLAAYMVYEGVNKKVPVPNFYWWWSCGHYYRNVMDSLGIHAPETRYCPAGSYWANVPAGSGVAAKGYCK
jgi:hypothetical protein